MVWIHGGGFVNGAGNDFYGGNLSRTANVIVVTVNYRLGPFGWLSLDTLSQEQGGHSGNYGLMDQVLALKWVKQNIHGFGGNPNLVTLFGQSAGGEATLALLASPEGSGLFQRAISHSAPTGISLPTVTSTAARNQANYATALGCGNKSVQLQCLRSQPAEIALRYANETFNLIKSGGLYWTPTVGGPTLPEQWLTSFRKGQYNRVPTMIGHTRNEGRLFTAIFENNNDSAITEQQLSDVGKENFALLSPAILAAYPEARNGPPQNRLASAITDAEFACGQQRDRDALVATGLNSLYGFQFVDPNAFNVEVVGKYEKIGDGHDADLPFLFQWNNGRVPPKNPPFTPPQLTNAVQIGMYWGNFARTGDPNGLGLPYWAPFNHLGAIQQLQPGNAASMLGVQYIAQHQCSLWIPILEANDLNQTITGS